MYVCINNQSVTCMKNNIKKKLRSLLPGRSWWGNLMCGFLGYSKFQQTMILPDNVDKEKIAASVEHGVLNIELPKLSEEEVKKPNRQIEIK